MASLEDGLAEPESSRERQIPLTNLSKKPPKISLQQAARDGKEDVVRHYLDRLADSEKQEVINARDSEGYTALHYAAKFNRFQIMYRLVTHDADPDAQTTEEKFTPLHFSCRFLPHIRDDALDLDGERGKQQPAQVATASTCRRAVQLLVNCRDLDVNVKNIYGVSSLHMSCSRGNEVALEELLKAPAIDLYAVDNHGDTALHEACLLGDEQIVEMLLKEMQKRHLNLLLPNIDRQTPLHFACKKGFTDIVKLLLQFGKHQMQEMVSTQDTEGNTPLHFATESGRLEIVRCILKCEAADIEAEKYDETTPLHIAAKYGHLEISQLIVSQKAEAMSCIDAYQQTPLHFAAKYNHSETIDYLLDKGADIEALDHKSYTPLLTAVAHGQLQALRTLLRRKATIDALDKNRKSAVYIASELKHTPVLHELLSKPDGRSLCRSADSVHDTPLHAAAKNGNLEGVTVLLREGVRIDARNDLGKTPLHFAAETGHAPVVQYLARFQNDTIYDEDHDANTPLHLACLNGHVAVARILIKANCGIETRNSKLWTPMDCAAAMGNSELVTLLINFEADVDPTDKNKVTPLHLAASEGHLKVVQLLLQKGADMSSTDQEGNNALDLAIDNGHESIALVFIKNPKWESALRNTTRTSSGGQTTPLRKLIRKMPKVAEEVLNKCTVSNAATEGTSEDSQSVYFNYEFLEDFRDPPRLLGSSIRRYTLRGERQGPSRSPADSKMTVDDDRMDMITKMKFRSGHNFSTSWGPIGFRKSRHPLSLMVESARTDLLKHPVAISLLTYKWEAYGRYIYYGNLLIYVFFLGFLTTFALLVPHPGTTTCKAVSSGNFGKQDNCTLSSGLSTEQQNIMKGNCNSVVSLPLMNFLIALSSFVILFSLIRLAMEVFQAIQLRILQYFLSWVNWIEIIVFSCAILFVTTIPNDCLCPLEWQWQVGAIAIFFGWVDLIIFIRKLPGTGIYVVMFVDIFYTFWRLFFLTILLVIAFGLSFYMAFYEPAFELRRSSFASPGRSIVKTITMTTGEFEYDSIFRQAPGGVEADDVNELGEVPYPPISYLLWIAFIILMPILLTNLLVGLAVDDIKGILKAAVLKRLALQVELALNVEELFPRGIRRWFMVGSRKINPNRKLSLLERARYTLQGGERFDSSENIAKALNPPLTPIEQVQLQNRKLLAELDQVKHSLSSLSVMVEALVSHQRVPMGRARRSDSEDATTDAREQVEVRRISHI